jgi:citrate lyase beta subunit
MIHHSYNKDFDFVKRPIEFNLNSKREILQYALGATLYMPGTKNITEKILSKSMTGITSMVMCFEDAIKESELEKAESNVIQHLENLHNAILDGVITENDVPLTFIRVRDTKQFQNFVHKLSDFNSYLLAGFVFPKFSNANGALYLSIFHSVENRIKSPLYCMPLLEGKAVAYKETRQTELNSLRNLLGPFKDVILNIRIGATDISSLFGVRRGINYSIYDILTVKESLSDILNFFGRSEDNYTVSGPVWEYFLVDSEEKIGEILKSNIHISLLNRNSILNEAIDGLLREVILDKANGFVGKTIIHPSHARFVNAMQAVTEEEYNDALQILETSGGVIKSDKANKMNEINPHRNWAKKIIACSEVYGVVENDLCYLKLITGIKN